MSPTTRGNSRSTMACDFGRRCVALRAAACCHNPNPRLCMRGLCGLCGQSHDSMRAPPSSRGLPSANLIHVVPRTLDDPRLQGHSLHQHRFQHVHDGPPCSRTMFHYTLRKLDAHLILRDTRLGLARTKRSETCLGISKGVGEGRLSASMYKQSAELEPMA